MIHQLAKLIEILAVLGTLCASAYYILTIAGALDVLRQAPNPDTPSLPGFSILKPLKGMDPGMYESLRSHFAQDYPQFEIIFGVSEPGDEALTLVQRLQSEFARVSVRVVICAQDLGTNTKVSNLAQMLPHASYEHIVVNDSDIRVATHYLRDLAAGLADPKVGLVTCLYRGVSGPSLGSKLESLFISTDFSAGVLAARLMEGGIHFGLGSTLAFRRADLARIGGFEALTDYLADDYEIGRRIAALGLRVELCRDAVETYLPSYSFRQFFLHQLRWLRTIRDSRPGGYAGLAVTFGIPWSILAVLCARGAAWAWAVAAMSVLLRLASAFIVGGSVLKDSQLARSWMLIPVRDLIGTMIWVFGFWGNRITWRGDAFALKDGKLSRIAP
jgi:ceramide glucosyltransferase